MRTIYHAKNCKVRFGDQVLQVKEFTVSDYASFRHVKSKKHNRSWRRREAYYNRKRAEGIKWHPVPEMFTFTIQREAILDTVIQSMGVSAALVGEPRP